MRKKRSLLAADIAECAVFAALMVAGSYVSVPFYPVPLTFQTVISVLSGLVLGARKGALSMTAYAVMGLIGIPVFSGGGGGLGYVVRPTFGYILGFVLAAFVAGAVRGETADASVKRYLVAASAAFLSDYAVGVLYFVAVWVLNGYEQLWSSVVLYNILYMPKDAVLCMAAGAASRRLGPLVLRAERRLSAGRGGDGAAAGK